MKECIAKKLEEFKHANELKDVKKVGASASNHVFEVNPNWY